MNLVVGLDEVGRGCWAGPLVACAALLDISKLDNTMLPWFINDSKLMSKNNRIVALELIKKITLDYGLGWVEPKEIDKLGLTKANTLAMQRALKNIKVPYDEIIIDGHINYLKEMKNTSNLIKADKKIPSVSAASIIAKVTRDSYMFDLDKKFPEYGFARNVGYGTKQHIEALNQYGPCQQHRFSYKPIRKFLN